MITKDTHISDIYFAEEEIEAVYLGNEEIWPEYNFTGKVSSESDNITTITNSFADRIDNEGNFKGYIDPNTTTITLESSFITEISQMPDLQNVTSALKLFYKSYLCSNIVSQILNKIKNTVENIGQAFWEAKLSDGNTIDLSGLSLQKVTNISNLFHSTKADKIILPIFNSNAVVAALELFLFSSAKEIYFNGFTAQAVKSAKSMFRSCTYLTKIDMSAANFKDCESFENMFSYCSALTQILYPAVPSDKVTSLKYMFNECKKLTEIDLTKFVSDDAVISNIDYLFYGCSTLRKIIMPECFNSTKSYNLSNVFGSSGIIDIEGPFPTPTGSFSFPLGNDFNTEMIEKIIDALERNPKTGASVRPYVRFTGVTAMWNRITEAQKQRALEVNWLLTNQIQY